MSLPAMTPSNARTETYFAHVADAIFVTHLDGRIIDANCAACELLGYCDEELRQMRPWDFVISATRDQIIDTMRHLQRGKSACVQQIHRRSDGALLTLDLRLTRFPDDESENSECDLVIVSCRDVTALHHAEEALRASEELARGQVRSLVQTLDAMARETTPDRFLEHMLSTIIKQMGAHNISVWQTCANGGLVGFEYSNCGGDLHEQVQRTRLYNTSVEDNHIWQMVRRSPKIATYENYVRIAKSDAPANTHAPQNDASFRERLNSQGIATSLLVPLLMTGEMVGCMGLRFKQPRDFRPDELEMMEALGHQATLALHLTRLSEQSRHAAIVAERDRFARDMHDTLAQGFTGVIVQLEAAEDAASKGLHRAADHHVHRAGEMARTGLGDARRSVLALRPQSLEENDLCAALQNLIEYSTHGTTLHATLNIEGKPRALPPHCDEHLLHIAQETLTNTLRHANATQFRAQLAFESDTLWLHLNDNGCGFDHAQPRDGLGLRGIRERVAQMRGTVTMHSDASGGTSLCVVLPLPDGGTFHDEHFA